MAPLEAAAALPTATDMDVELSIDGATRDLDLVLLGNVDLVDDPAAVGTGIGQERLEGLIDVRGRCAVGLGAIVTASFASWSFGLRLGWSLGKGGRLALAGTLRLFELSRKFVDLTGQLRYAPLEGRTSWTGTIHRFRLAAGDRSSCASFQQKRWVRR